MRRIVRLSGWAAVAALLLAVVMLPGQAHAWVYYGHPWGWHHYWHPGWYRGGWHHPFWVPGHWGGAYWVRGHWA